MDSGLYISGSKNSHLTFPLLHAATSHVTQNKQLNMTLWVDTVYKALFVGVKGKDTDFICAHERDVSGSFHDTVMYLVLIFKMSLYHSQIFNTRDEID
jgi:hypothetical protein